MGAASTSETAVESESRSAVPQAHWVTDVTVRHENI